jgi:26S proteasome regulatory subunit T1
MGTSSFLPYPGVHLTIYLLRTIGVKESDTGLAPPNLWDIPADKQRMSEEHPLQVARCTKIIRVDPVKAAAAAAVNPAGALQGQKGADEQDQYVINIKQIAKFVVGLGERVAPTDVEEGMRVGCVPLLSPVRSPTHSH